jgi:ribose transport system ATP-binding protein
MAVLEFRHIAKTFPGQRALVGVDFSVEAGEVHALLGHNGSGKSTLIKIMAGVLQPDRDADAAYFVDGQPMRFADPSAVIHAGIRFIHQDLALGEGLSVLENLRMGVGLYETGALSRISWRKERARARRQLDELGLTDLSPDDIVGSLSAVRKTEVAIARAAVQSQQRQRVLVLDEPTAALPDEEVDRLFALIRRLQARGAGIVYVSHRLEEVFAIADRVTVLREGSVVYQSAVAETTLDGLVTLVAGGEGARLSRVDQPEVDQREAVLEFDRVTSEELRGATFAVYPGEVVGLAGLSGSGVHDVTHILAGLKPLFSGEVRIQGGAVPSSELSIRPLRRRGVSVLLADRTLKGFPLLTVRENTTIADLSPFWRHGWLNGRLERRYVRELLGRYTVRPAQPERQLSTLSGGNQQKVFLARWLRTNPVVLVLDEPNQGVDVAGSAEILAELGRAAREQGVAVLICSSDLEDLQYICGRVLILRNGLVTDVLQGEEVTRDVIVNRCYAGAAA